MVGWCYINCYSLMSPKLKDVGIYDEAIHCCFVKSERVPPQFCMACVHRENWRHDDKAVVSEAAKLMWMKSPVTRWDPHEAGDCMSFLYLSTSNISVHILYAYLACVVYIYIYSNIHSHLLVAKEASHANTHPFVRNPWYSKEIEPIAICPAGCSHIYKQIHQFKVLNYRMPIINIQQDIHI